MGARIAASATGIERRPDVKTPPPNRFVGGAGLRPDQLRSLRAARIEPSEFIVELPEFIELPEPLELLLEGIVEDDEEDEEGIVLDEDDEDDGIVELLEDDGDVVLEDDEGEVVLDDDGIVVDDDEGEVVLLEELGVVVVVELVPVVVDVPVVPVALGMPGGVVEPCVPGWLAGTVLLESPEPVAPEPVPVPEDCATATLPTAIRQAAAMAVVDFRKELM